MKTFFVCAENAIESHVGENYDDILEVSNQPTSPEMEEWANRVMDRIRRLHANDADATEDERVVSIWLDATGPFNAMLIDLQVLMKERENINIALPYLDSQDEEEIKSDDLRKILNKT